MKKQLVVENSKSKTKKNIYEDRKREGKVRCKQESKEGNTRENAHAFPYLQARTLREGRIRGDTNKKTNIHTFSVTKNTREANKYTDRKKERETKQSKTKKHTRHPI